MPLPGEELVWVPTEAEVTQRRATAARVAYQDFCHCGQSHTGLGRRPLTPKLSKIYNLARVGWGAGQIAGRMKISHANVNDALVKIKHNGWKY